MHHSLGLMGASSYIVKAKEPTVLAGQTHYDLLGIDLMLGFKVSLNFRLNIHPLTVLFCRSTRLTLFQDPSTSSASMTRLREHSAYILSSPVACAVHWNSVNLGGCAALSYSFLSVYLSSCTRLRSRMMGFPSPSSTAIPTVVSHGIRWSRRNGI